MDENGQSRSSRISFTRRSQQGIQTRASRAMAEAPRGAKAVFSIASSSDDDDNSSTINKDHINSTTNNINNKETYNNSSSRFSDKFSKFTEKSKNKDLNLIVHHVPTTQKVKSSYTQSQSQSQSQSQRQNNVYDDSDEDYPPRSKKVYTNQSHCVQNVQLQNKPQQNIIENNSLQKPNIDKQILNQQHQQLQPQHHHQQQQQQDKQIPPPSNQQFDITTKQEIAAIFDSINKEWDAIFPPLLPDIPLTTALSSQSQSQLQPQSQSSEKLLQTSPITRAIINPQNPAIVQPSVQPSVTHNNNKQQILQKNEKFDSEDSEDDPYTSAYGGEVYYTAKHAQKRSKNYIYEKSRELTIDSFLDDNNNYDDEEEELRTVIKKIDKADSIVKQKQEKKYLQQQENNNE